MASSNQLVRTSSSSTSSNLTLKLLVDIDSQRVVYAEADKAAVDFLFSLLSLPISTVIQMLTRDPAVGCVGNLYRSVHTLPDRYLCHRYARAAKDALLRPTGACRSGLLLLLTNARISTHRSGLVKEIDTFYTVTDSLKINPPSGISTTAIVSSFGIRDMRCLREKIVGLDDNVGLQILRASLQSKRVLTDVFLRTSSWRALIAT